LLLEVALAESGIIATRVTIVIAISSTFVKAFFILSPLVFSVPDKSSAVGQTGTSEPVNSYHFEFA